MKPVTDEHLMPEFLAAWPVLERALNVYPFQTCSKSYLFQQIATGAMRLWRMGDSAMVTSQITNPAGLKIVSVHLAGGELSEVVEMERDISSLARHAGIDGIQICGRRGWLRAFDGYEDAGTMMGKCL